MEITNYTANELFSKFNVKCDENTKKNFIMAIEKSHIDTMNNLGNYYYIEKDYENAKQYYLMAIEKGHIGAMNNLGNYYTKVEKNYTKADIYIRMSKLKLANKEEECFICYENKIMYLLDRKIFSDNI